MPDNRLRDCTNSDIHVKIKFTLKTDLFSGGSVKIITELEYLCFGKSQCGKIPGNGSLSPPASRH